MNKQLLVNNYNELEELNEKIKVSLKGKKCNFIKRKIQLNELMKEIENNNYFKNLVEFANQNNFILDKDNPRLVGTDNGYRLSLQFIDNEDIIFSPLFPLIDITIEQDKITETSVCKKPLIIMRGIECLEKIEFTLIR